MKRFSLFAIAIVITIVMINCGKKVMVPPRVDLSDYQVIGIIQFTSSEKGKLASLATTRFMDAARQDQGVIRIIELGTEKALLKEIGQSKFNQTSYQEIGKTYNVATVVVGELDVSDVRPDITITPGLGYMSFAAEVDASLATQMVETETGATIWSKSASATERVGDVSIFGLEHFSFDSENPDKAYGNLIDALVERVTRDFRVTWERR